jgi:hypothetical protein
MSDQTITGRKSMSLEQQVRIAAGTFVLISALLTYFVHPYFVGLTAFFGTGLIFAGITNTCVMSFVLVKLPWNKGPEAPASCVK